MMRYLLGKNRAEQAWMFVVVVCATLATLIPIHLFRLIIDKAIPSRDNGLLILLAGALLSVLVIGAVLDYVKAVLARRIQEFFVSDLRLSLMSHIMDLPSEYFASNPVGKLVNRIMHDVARFGMGIEWLLVNPAIAAATIVLYAAYLISIDPLLTLLAVAPLPVIVFITTRISGVLGAHRGTVVEASGTYSASVNEIMLAATEIQSNGTYRRESRRLQEEHRKLSEAGVREASLLARISVVSGAYRDFVPILIYCYGGWMALSGDLSVGRVVAFAGAFGGLYLAIDTLINYLPLYQNVRDRYAELQKILDAPRIGPAAAAATATAEEAETLQASSADKAGTAIGGLRLSDMTFAHASGARIINRLSVDIPQGQHVALIGRSGCGKSTLLNLIAGRLAPASGSISYYGLPHDRLTADKRVALISYVQQSPFLFAGSLRSNLLYGVSDDPRDHSYDSAQLLAACVKAGLEHDMLQFGLEMRIPADEAGPFLRLRPEITAAMGAGAAANEMRPWDEQTSIRANLAPTGCDMDDSGVARKIAESIVAAVAGAGLGETVRMLGLEFDVGERGSRLSGGQRQKISIVRALLRKRPILLLDEVTASLDENSARTVLRLLQTDLRDITVIAITHELDSLGAFDRVIALKDGEIAADSDAGTILRDNALLASVLDRTGVETT